VVEVDVAWVREVGFVSVDEARGEENGLAFFEIELGGAGGQSCGSGDCTEGDCFGREAEEFGDVCAEVIDVGRNGKIIDDFGRTLLLSQLQKAFK